MVISYVFIVNQNYPELLSYNPLFYIPYFLGYRMEVFPFQNIPKYLDLTYKTDLDFLDCFGKEQEHRIGVSTLGCSCF